MRRVHFGAGILVLGLAALLWTAAPVDGGKGHAGGGHSGGGHSAPAHTGSVHYAARPAPAHAAPAHAAPARVSPAVRTGSVHYAGSGNRGGSEDRGGSGNRGGAGYGGGYGGYGGYGGTRYNSAYFNLFPPGYLPFMLSDGDQYYGYYNLPPGYTQMVSNGITYDYFNGLYYQPYMIDGRTVYVVVPN